MDDFEKLPLTNQMLDNQPTSGAQNAKRWLAKLDLDFKCEKGRSFLARNSHVGPLVLQKTLYPEGEEVCCGIVIHPPGGVAGGDALTLNVNVAEQAKVQLTTPGAGKWYKANGLTASQCLHFNVQAHACLEWLPQENILFDGSHIRFNAEVNLEEDACYAAWDILCFGRQAQAEVWQTGSLHQNMTIRRNGRLIWNERAFLKPEQSIIQSMVGLNGHAVSASFVIAAGAVPPELLQRCREVRPELALELHAKYGVTALPEIFSARYVGQSAQCARQYFEALWQILRPWYAKREVMRPRIWST
jgi:urease accessory protein